MSLLVIDPLGADSTQWWRLECRPCCFYSMRLQLTLLMFPRELKNVISSRYRVGIFSVPGLTAVRTLAWVRTLDSPATGISRWRNAFFIRGLSRWILGCRYHGQIAKKRKDSGNSIRKITDYKRQNIVGSSWRSGIRTLVCTRIHTFLSPLLHLPRASPSDVGGFICPVLCSFSNQISTLAHKKLFFAIHKDEDVHKALADSKSVDPLKGLATDLEEKVQQAKDQLQYMAIRETRHQQSLCDKLPVLLNTTNHIIGRVHAANHNTNVRVTVWSIIEAVTVACVCLLQVFILKQFFEVKQRIWFPTIRMNLLEKHSHDISRIWFGIARLRM